MMLAEEGWVKRVNFVHRNVKSLTRLVGAVLTLWPPVSSRPLVALTPTRFVSATSLIRAPTRQTTTERVSLTWDEYNGSKLVSVKPAWTRQRDYNYADTVGVTILHGLCTL